MSTAGALWKHLLDLARLRVTPETVETGQPKPRYQMWLERDWAHARRGTR